MRLRNKKTGEVFDAVVREKSNDNGEYSIIVCNIRAIRNRESSFLGEYDSLAGLNEDWEDYKPAEPLIKDEKIRKAVRAWAEASDVGVAKVAPFGVFDIESSARIYFYGRVIEDKDYGEKKSYTITELCGEKEEPEDDDDEEDLRAEEY